LGLRLYRRILHITFILTDSHIDRDCSRWNFDSKTVDRRRALFWELFSGEQFYVSSPYPSSFHTFDNRTTQSLALGRPPSIRLSYIDCEFPEDDEATLDENGNTLVGCQSSIHD